MPAESPLIDIQSVTRRFGFRPVLRGLSLTIPRGQSLALMGANGAGKSTLLRLLAGLGRPDAGLITIGGWDIPREAAQVRGHLGFVAHKPLLYDGLTARENLLFFGRLYGLGGYPLEARADALLADVGLKKRSHDLVRGFSRGMLQRLSIARALIHQPDILLLDEPFTGLDLAGVDVLMGVIDAARAEGKTIVLTTHEPAHALRLCDRVVVIRTGVIGLDAPSADFATPDDLARAYLG